MPKPLLTTGKAVLAHLKAELPRMLECTRFLRNGNPFPTCDFFVTASTNGVVCHVRCFRGSICKTLGNKTLQILIFQLEVVQEAFISVRSLVVHQVHNIVRFSTRMPTTRLVGL